MVNGGINKFSIGLAAWALIAFGSLAIVNTAEARDVEYNSAEFTVFVKPGEPTRIEFPGVVQGGYIKKLSSLHVDNKGSDLIVFANEGISEEGEAIIVRLDDSRSYSVRIRPEDSDNPRDALIRVKDGRAAYVEDDEVEKAYNEGKFDYAPPSKVSGLIREMVLAAEFGKNAIPGYRVSDRYKGQTVLSDGAITAKIDKIFIGPNLWGYVLDAVNHLDQTVQVNPASFRMDGTRAISAEQWELAPRPLNIEQQISNKHSTKLYIVTRAKKFR